MKKRLWGYSVKEVDKRIGEFEEESTRLKNRLNQIEKELEAARITIKEKEQMTNVEEQLEASE